MTPYPKELRVRVVAAVAEGRFAIPEIARLFQVGVTFIKKRLTLHRAGDPLAPRHGGAPPLPCKSQRRRGGARKSRRAPMPRWQSYSSSWRTRARAR
jgi:transposase-like protein